MTKFLIRACYTADGVKGLLKDGGTERKKIVEKMIADLGGKLEAFYYGFGHYDVYAIGELPDALTVAAVSFAINAAGLVNLSTVILLDPSEIDKAVKKTVQYRSPGN